MTIAGDIKSITVTNPLVGTHEFYAMGAESGSMSLGGNIVQSDENGIAGGGQEPVYSRQSQRAYFEVPCACDTAMRDDLTMYRNFQESQQESTATITLNNGTVFKFTGMLVGTGEMDTMAGTFTFRIEGRGEKIG